MNLAIETKHLTKHYGRVHAVEDLSLQVTEGEIYAFLGLNGAGKTTTIRMLLGMIKPSAGAARVLQTPVGMGNRHPWESVGYLVETPHAYTELTVRENLEACRRLHPGTPAHAVGDVIERLGLAEYAVRRAGTLSLGNAQRLGLAKALLHNPSLLILDEPANGLDPAGIVEIRRLLLELSREQGVTIFMSSHILAEVARLARRIGIIHQGRLLQELNIEDLERKRRRRLLLHVSEEAKALAALSKGGGMGAGIAGYDAHPMAEGVIEISDPRAIERPEDITCLLVAAGAPPAQVFIDEEDLESYFLRLIGNDGGTPHA